MASAFTGVCFFLLQSSVPLASIKTYSLHTRDCRVGTTGSVSVSPCEVNVDDICASRKLVKEWWCAACSEWRHDWRAAVWRRSAADERFTAQNIKVNYPSGPEFGQLQYFAPLSVDHLSKNHLTLLSLSSFCSALFFLLFILRNSFLIRVEFIWFRRCSYLSDKGAVINNHFGVLLNDIDLHLVSMGQEPNKSILLDSFNDILKPYKNSDAVVMLFLVLIDSRTEAICQKYLYLSNAIVKSFSNVTWSIAYIFWLFENPIR